MPTTIESLTGKIRMFRDARDWKQFHNPKEMAVAVAPEAGELLQHFVWLSREQAEDRVVQRKGEIAEEMADIGILLFEFADNCSIDLAQAMEDKLARNHERYPVAKSKGTNKKYNEL